MRHHRGGLVGIDSMRPAIAHYCRGSYFLRDLFEDAPRIASSIGARRSAWAFTPWWTSPVACASGPDAEFLKGTRSRLPGRPGEARGFRQGVRRLVPSLTEEDLSPTSAGSPQVQAPGEPARDFIIRDESDRGYAGLINLIGIESPV